MQASRSLIGDEFLRPQGTATRDDASDEDVADKLERERDPLSAALGRLGSLQ